MCETIWFRSRPEQVEVVRLDDDNAAEIARWVRSHGGAAHIDDAGDLVLGTGAAEQLPRRSAAIVRDGTGRFVAMSASELEARFEPLAS